MDTELIIKIPTEERSINDFQCHIDGWNFLEADANRELSTISFFKWVYALSTDIYMSRAIITVGKWNSAGMQKNKYFVRGSKNTGCEDLVKLQKFESVQTTINSIATKANTYYVENDWTVKYPKIVRYGIRPTEVEIESMSSEELSKYPTIIKQL